MISSGIFRAPRDDADSDFCSAGIGAESFLFQSCAACFCFYSYSDCNDGGGCPDHLGSDGCGSDSGGGVKANGSFLLASGSGCAARVGYTRYRLPPGSRTL